MRIEGVMGLAAAGDNCNPPPARLGIWDKAAAP
jgi:hypothetical protein